jgi:hypothetical protein
MSKRKLTVVFNEMDSIRMSVNDQMSRLQAVLTEGKPVLTADERESLEDELISIDSAMAEIRRVLETLK